MWETDLPWSSWLLSGWNLGAQRSLLPFAILTLVPCSMLGCISPHSLLVTSLMDRMKLVTCKAGTWFLASTSLTCHFHHFSLKLNCKWNFAFLFSVLGSHACGVSYHDTNIWYLFAYCRCKLLGKKTSLLLGKKKGGVGGAAWPNVRAGEMMLFRKWPFLLHYNQLFQPGTLNSLVLLSNLY